MEKQSQTTSSPTELPEPGYTRIAVLIVLTTLSRASIWRKSKNGTFPKPVRLSDNCTVLRNEDINNWLRDKAENPDNSPNIKTVNATAAAMAKRMKGAA
jgi:prophage regulatory protein